ncbi:hypothetical protein [Actinoplanes sp. NPDC026670]|uniref:hypothetical protein n=1 Tax=Actinoplanes sp. NPDC026670 TaxID=3154700 RepID=UPI0034024DFD
MGEFVEFLMIHPALVERPDRVLMVAGAFAVVGVLALVARTRRLPIASRSWPCFAVAVLWVLYALWEAHLTGKGFNIRVDLLLLHPFLSLLSISALVSVLWRSRVRTPATSAEAVP